jgi:hypothetical protein
MAVTIRVEADSYQAVISAMDDLRNALKGRIAWGKVRMGKNGRLSVFRAYGTLNPPRVQIYAVIDDDDTPF